MNTEKHEATYGAYRIDPGGRHEDGSPALLYVVAEGVSYGAARAAVEVDQIRYWDPCDAEVADGGGGVWVYEADNRRYAIVELDEDGQPIWLTDDSEPADLSEVDFDDVCTAAGIKEFVLLLGDLDRSRTLLADLWAEGIAVVSYYDDTTTDTSDEQDAAQIDARIAAYGCDRVVCVADDGKLVAVSRSL
ncbi:MAG: hypothetical protein ACHREM_04815 [Polyangiales bacterium]